MRFDWSKFYRETQFNIKLPVFKERKCSYLYNNCVSLNESKNCKIFLRLHHLPDPPTVFRSNLACLSMLPFARVLSDIQKYFPKHWSIKFFSTFRIEPDILMNVPEDCIVFLTWAAWVLFFICAKATIFSLELYWKCLLHLRSCRNWV